MSDFTSPFWSIYVAGLTLLGIAACVALLWWTQRMNTEVHADDSTGHVWDETLTEKNNPLPRWWIGMFAISCVFGVVYLLLYPGLGSFGGWLGWSQVEQFGRQVQQSEEKTAPIYAAFESLSIEQLAGNSDAMATGDRLFMNNCAQCHGSDARGSLGFPDLTDAHWSWGGTPAQILQTIADGRIGNMPPMAAAVGDENDVRNVANYVLSLSGAPHDAERAKEGAAKFAVCAACHGTDGKGNPALGAPDLTAGIFRHGPASEAHIMAMIENGKVAEMPAWAHRFSTQQLRVLAAYVWGHGGGIPEPAKAQAAAETNVQAGSDTTTDTPAQPAAGDGPD